jgi:hypothetical protein
LRLTTAFHAPGAAVGLGKSFPNRTLSRGQLAANAVTEAALGDEPQAPVSSSAAAVARSVVGPSLSGVTE